MEVIDRRRLPGAKIGCHCVRCMTEESFEYIKHPAYYGPKTNFRTASISHSLPKPFKFMPAYLERDRLRNVCEEMSVLLEAVKI